MISRFIRIKMMTQILIKEGEDLKDPKIKRLLLRKLFKVIRWWWSWKWLFLERSKEVKVGLKGQKISLNRWNIKIEILSSFNKERLCRLEKEEKVDLKVVKIKSKPWIFISWMRNNTKSSKKEAVEDPKVQKIKQTLLWVELCSNKPKNNLWKFNTFKSTSSLIKISNVVQNVYKDS